MKLSEIAARINAHLKRFEADPVINAPSKTWGTRPFYYATAAASGRYVGVIYVSYQGHTYITKDDALRYLAALDAGFVGRHWEALRGSSETA